jgi:class 3 adenylate cyclase
MEKSFKSEIELLRLGNGQVFHGEGILAITKALLQSGVAYVGGVGTAEGVNDMTALGDAMNTTARLASQAAAGEALVSEKAYAASGLDRGNPEQRYLTLKGRTKPVCIRVLRPAAA